MASEDWYEFYLSSLHRLYNKEELLSKFGFLAEK